MSRVLPGFFGIWLCLSLIGCGSVGKDFNTSNVKNIQNNVTTQAQILEWFGVPFKEGKENGAPMWTYQYDKYKVFGGSQSKDLVILFDQNDVVKAYRFTSNMYEE